MKTGVVFIGMPDYNALMRQRTAQMNLTVGPPFVPDTFAKLVNQTDPAMTPYTSKNASKNPFWHKHIFQANGGDDPLVPFNLSEHFLSKLVLGPPSKRTNESLQIYVEPNIPHDVTPNMIKLAAQWIYRWELAKTSNVKMPHIRMNGSTMSRPYEVTATPSSVQD